MGHGRHPSVDDRALRVVLQVVLDGATTVGDLKAALRAAGFDSDATVATLERQSLIETNSSTSVVPEDGRHFRSLIGDRPTISSADAIVLIDRPFRDHVRAIVQVGGQRVEEPPVEINPAALAAITSVARAVESHGDHTVTRADVDHGQEVLGRALFGDWTIAALRRLVETGCAVHLRLHASGELVDWPWELATQTHRVDDLCDHGMVGMSRLVGAATDAPLHFPGEPERVRVDGIVDYTHLSPDLRLAQALGRNWPVDLVRRPEPAELWAATSPDVAAQVAVLSGHGHLPETEPWTELREPERSLACALHVEHHVDLVGAAQVAAGVLARRPRTAMLGICHSATEYVWKRRGGRLVTMRMPSLGRLVAAGGVEQVFAFRGKVQLDALRRFTGTLLDELSVGNPVSYAAAKGRQAIDGRLARTQLVVFGGGSGR